MHISVAYLLVSGPLTEVEQIPNSKLLAVALRSLGRLMIRYTNPLVFTYEVHTHSTANISFEVFDIAYVA